MASPPTKTELANNLEVLLLLIFMVAGIFFMKQLLLFVFTRLLLSIQSKVRLGVTFCLAAAFLDALTVLAVVISVAVSFYEIYHRVASDPHYQQHPLAQRETLEQFRAFLRSLMMQAGVGTALGGVMTMVGEPQNLIIAHAAGWDFVQFFLRMAPVTVPVLLCGIMTSIAVEKFKWFGYGVTLPVSVRQLLEESEQQKAAQRSRQETLKGGDWHLVDCGAGVSPSRSRPDWFIRDYYGDGAVRYYRRAHPRTGVYRSVAFLPHC